jgi:GTPase SAR1 family protein
MSVSLDKDARFRADLEFAQRLETDADLASLQFSDAERLAQQLFERDSQQDAQPSTQPRESTTLSPAPVQQPVFSPARAQPQAGQYVISQPSSPPQAQPTYARSTSGSGSSFREQGQQSYTAHDVPSRSPPQQSYNQPPPSNYAPQPNYAEMENARKRKREVDREEEEQWYRNVSRKIDDERKKVDHDEEQHYQSNKDLYALFNDLQGISADFNISFESPELVVVGMQSDGKSTFIEGLLGFQFNIVDTNIGTRRPLIIQMINNPEREQPRCRFRKETAVAAGEDAFEDIDTPVNYLSDEIVRRTDMKTGSDKDRVSDQPIILRVEYRHCANLTIYDTPGFRLGGNEKLRKDIEEMVVRIMKPKNRIIICLEQSTVEWANTVSRPLVRTIDPNFSRTVLVNTKFDNRVKELRDSDSANKYLVGENLPAGKRPFFVSMPVRRNLDPQRFSDQIKEAYLADYRQLLGVRFDDKKYGTNIGFFKLKAYLERLLHQKYSESIAPTLQVLENLVENTQEELSAVRNELRQADIESQKNKVHSFVQSFALLIDRFLEGSVIGDPDRYGQTLKEEKIESGVGDWPNFDIKYDIQNSEFKVYGGAQYERLLNEFEYVAHSIEFPKTSINEVASALGTSKSHNVPLFEAAASDIVQMKAKRALLPLIQYILRRCAYIMKRLFDVAVNVITKEEAHTFGIIGQYEQFQKELRGVFNGFIEKTQRECEQKALDDFGTFTKILDWDLMTGVSEYKEYDYLNCTKDDTKKRVESMMALSKTSHLAEGNRSRIVDQDTYQRVLMMAGKLFVGVRYFFTKYIRNKFNAFFLDPMFQKLTADLTEHFRKMTNDQYEVMFNLGIAQLREKAGRLELQLARFIENRDRFKDVYSRIKDATTMEVETM